MKNYKIVLLVVSASALIIIANLLIQNFYLKKQNDLLFASLNQVVKKIGDLEVVSLKKETKGLKPQLEGGKGNRGFLIKNSRSTYTAQDKAQ